MKILLTNNYNPELLTIGNVKDKSIGVYYPIEDKSEEFSKLRIQTPRFKIPFNPDERKTKENKIFVKNISLSTDEIGSDLNKKNANTFRMKIEETDQKIKSLLPPPYNEKNLSPSLWQSKNLTYKPTMRITLPYSDEVCKTAVYNEKDDKIQDTDVCRNSIISAIIRLDGIWLWGDKMGVNWVAEQIKIYEDTPKKSKIFFRDEDNI